MITDKVASSGAIETVASKITYTAAGSTVIFGLAANEVAAIGGLIVAVVAMVIQAVTTWYFKAQHLKLAKEEMKDRRQSDIPVEIDRRRDDE